MLLGQNRESFVVKAGRKMRIRERQNEKIKMQKDVRRTRLCCTRLVNPILTLINVHFLAFCKCKCVSPF